MIPLIWVRLLVCTLATALCCSAQVLINEALYRIETGSSDQLKSHQWVELFNKSTDPVDLTGWMLSGREGATGPSAKTLPAVTLPSGSYLVVHFSTGTDRLDFSEGSGESYTGDSAGVLNPDTDELALYSPAGIVDFIAWARKQAVYTGGQALADAEAAGIWKRGALIASDGITVEEFEKPRPVLPGNSIGRDPESTDTDAPADFEPRGGVGALDNSPGRRNEDQITIEEVDGAAPAANGRRSAGGMKKWTVLLYFNADNSLEKYIYGNVQEIDAAGGSDDNVNFVLLYDGKRFSRGTHRGLIRPGGDPRKLTLERVLGERADIGERNLGDPAELRSFITWAKANYPAERYALIMSAHGNGWKGYGPDESSRGKYGSDNIYMGELRQALEGQSFDLIGFDACLMAGVEVADQIRESANYYVASETLIPGQGYPYDAFAQELKANPGWTGLDLGKRIVQAYAVRYAQLSDWTLSLVDLKRLIELVNQVDAWSTLLKHAAGLFQMRDAPFDNVQVLIRNQLHTSQTFSSSANFVDLYDLANRILQDSGIPACAKGPIRNILTLIDGQVVVTEVHSSDISIAKGLHIYFPRDRMLGVSWANYDLPNTRIRHGDSRLAVYAPNHDALPLKARDEDDGSEIPRTDWPAPATPDFQFVRHTHWSEFLERYYHPVADNRILKGVAPDGKEIGPTTLGGGACANGWDEITVPVGSVVYFSGVGASDADRPAPPVMPPAPPVPNIFPMYYFWDMDAAKDCAGGCIAPYEVPPGAEAALGSTDNVDADRDIARTPWDEKDVSGPTTTKVCEAPGQFVVTLIVWDDNHLPAFHNTIPDANYVHPQTNSHQAIVNCAPRPTNILIDEPPGTIPVDQPVFVFGVLKAPSAAGEISVPNYPMMITTTPTTPPVNVGGTRVAPGGSLELRTTRSGTFSMEFTPSSPGAGQVTVSARGGPSRTLSFNVIPAIAATNLTLAAPPGGRVALGASGTVTATLRNGTQPVAGAPVSFESPAGLIRFVSGRLYGNGLSTQVMTDASGMAQATFQAQFAGAAFVIARMGRLIGTARTDITGTPSTAPVGVTVTRAPETVEIGQPAVVVVVAGSQTALLPGTRVTVQTVRGNLTYAGAPGASRVTVVTGSDGLGSVTFTANDPTPIELRFTVEGTSLSYTLYLPVRLP